MTGQLSSGLPDDAFASDGLLTKRVLRAAALAWLAPRRDELLWDLGAGTGSISIEWCRLAPTNHAIAVERNPERVSRIRANADAHGVQSQVDVVTLDIQTALPVLPVPHAIFLGGGIEEQTLQFGWAALLPGGRFVAHSVTADSDALLLDAHRTWGGDLTRIAVETAEPIGRFTGFRPARTVTAWAATKD